MDTSKRFMEILTAIDYHVGHLPKDLWVNEEQIPELQPVFALLVNKLSPKTNCVTPKELALYGSLTSKHDQFSSIDKVLKGIDKFYDENTKDTKISSSDIKDLEKKILKSQQKLNKLKETEDSYLSKKCEIDNELSFIKEEKTRINASSYRIQDCLKNIVNQLVKELDIFGVNLNKLHDNVSNSIKDDSISLTKLASTNVIKMTELWRVQILNLINMWFGSYKVPSSSNDLFSNQIHQLSLVSQSITELRMREIMERCEIMKINIALNNINSIKNDLVTGKEHICLNELNLKNFIVKNYMKQHEITVDSDLHMTTAEANDLQERTSSLVITDAKRKLLELETIQNRISFVHDAMEHYLLICDLLWCLIRTSCSITNLKCELVVHCIRVLQIMFDDIKRSEKWTINYTEDDVALKSTAEKSTREVKYEGINNLHLKNGICKEMENIMVIVTEWQFKYKYSQISDEELKKLSQVLNQYTEIMNGITSRTN